MQRAFTTKYGALAGILTAKIGICLPKDVQGGNVRVHQYVGIWDTGASTSAITKEVIHALDLKPIGFTNIYHAGGKSRVNVFLISVILEDDVMISDLEVTEAELVNENLLDHEQFHILIGMDIINHGDLAITNYHQKTTLSFRVPSVEEVDFVAKKRKNAR